MEREMMKGNKATIGCGCLVLIAVVFLFSFKSVYLPLCTQDTVTATVVKTERVVSDKDSKYLVFTDKEVFRDTDCLVLWKWNSSDIYGALLPGKTYRFRVYGWRWQFMSWYRNIVSAEAQEGDQ